ncbi:MAG: hypothetical protein WC822_06665 [Candidatus Paceibacterota bacterium]|jgi:hypothetical protein
MADEFSPFALNIRGVTDLVESKTNKVPTGSDVSPEGQTGERYDSLRLNMSDEELLALRDEYEKRYFPYESKLKEVWKRNLESYLGKKADGQWLVSDGPVTANLQFEAEETFLSAALAKNPEPVVYADNSEEGNAIASDVKTMLAFHADQLVLRRKFALMVRQWSIYHLGVLKHGWRTVKDGDGNDIGDVDVQNRRIQDFVFDPDGYVDAYGDFIGALGERIEVTAEKLIEMYPEHKGYIDLQVDGKLGSKVKYTEWWSADDKFTFITFKEKVLDKHKNQYFKYPEAIIDPITGEEAADPLNGEPMMTKVRNHFSQPKKPYTFLSVFSLQEQPHDITGNIEQNIANQRKLTARTEQIDYNVSASNNGYAYSEDNFNQETAKQASTARRKGNPILVPSGGPIEKAILPLPAQDLPVAIFNEVEITKNDMRSSWGIQGIASQPPDEDQTARGMILNQSHDTSRIGGGVGSAVEQVADNVFNYLTQLYYVFYDEQHFAAIMGNAKAVEFVTLSNASLDRQLIVSVSPDSLKPKDEVTQINLAQALFDKGAIGPKTLLKMLDFPNPDESAADGVLYRIDPMAYFQVNFPEEFAAMQQSQMEQAQLQMQQQAQATGMNAEAEAAAAPEQANGEPKQPLSREPASAALSNVPLPQ